MRTLWVIAMMLALAGSIPAHAYGQENDTTADEPVPRRSWVQTGIASFYGRWHRGRLTSSGERFDPRAMTCAHRTLPMHAIVRVTVIDTGATLVLVVNDRGPYIHHRVLDVSQGAAQRLGMEPDGLARVRIEQIGQESDDEVAMAEEREARAASRAAHHASYRHHGHARRPHHHRF